MNSLFLFGDVSNNFAVLSEPFVRACGGKRARIALLMLPDSEEYQTRYRESWISTGADQVIAIYPSKRLSLSSEQFRTISESTGIFMAGGDTALYYRIYGTEAISRMISDRYNSGIPYGGVSSGAMMACDACTIAGAKIRTVDNEFLLTAKPYATARDEERPQLVIKKGFGLIKNCIVQPHFSEFGLFPKLITAMSLSQSRFGIGMDEGMCVEIENGMRARASGRGRVYFLIRNAAKSDFLVKTFEPDSHFWIRAELRNR